MGLHLPADLEATVLSMSVPARRPPPGNPRARLTADPAWGPKAEATRPVSLTVVVRVPAPNPLNGSHGHWSVASGRARKQYQGTLDALEAARLEGRIDGAGRAALAAGCVATLRRICRGRGLDDDGLRAALKHYRDGVAAWLLGGKPGEMDGDARLCWGYEQGSLGRASGVIVSLERR